MEFGMGSSPRRHADVLIHVIVNVKGLNPGTNDNR